MLALDACAGDFGAPPNIDGAIAAANRLGVKIALVGPAAVISAELGRRGVSADDPRFELVDAPDVIAMDEEPASACRAKPRASIMVCAELVASGRAQGLVSVGHSGATMVAALWHLKRVPGVLRPAIATVIPTPARMTVLLDAGANADCKAWHLLQFGVMGTVYCKSVLGIEKPTVGLLSIGEEEGKGNELVKETFPLLKSSGLEFFGTVEGRDIPAGKTDVVVCDGFVGNVCVKLMEGTCSTIFGMLKGALVENPVRKFAALLLQKPFGQMKKRLSYDEYGGAPLLGVNGVAIIAHGGSNAKAVSNALRVASELAAGGVSERIREAVEQVKSSLETTKL